MNDFTDNTDAVSAAIEGAEAYHDPLEGLVERAASNPKSAFEPEVLERLATAQK